MQIDSKVKAFLTYVQGLFNKPVYLVGGAVRDLNLGKEPKDFDFCSALTTEEVKKQIKGIHKSYKIGEKHGTIGFKVEHEMVEITTFRTEIYKPGSRKPIVRFVDDLHIDLGRRDYTINAMAINCKTFELIDPFNGMVDLKYKTLRAVGDSKVTFRDDPLRIMRGVRISAQYNLTIVDKTKSRLQKMAPLLLTISKERWMDEFDKILSLEGSNLYNGLQRLWSLDTFRYTIPELALQFNYSQDSPYHDFLLHDHTTKLVGMVPNDIHLRWAALLHDVAKPFTRTINKRGYSNYINHALLGAEMVNKIAIHLKWSTDRRKAVVDLVKNHLDKDSVLKEYNDASKRSPY